MLAAAVGITQKVVRVGVQRIVWLAFQFTSLHPSNFTIIPSLNIWLVFAVMSAVGHTVVILIVHPVPVPPVVAFPVPTVKPVAVPV